MIKPLRENNFIWLTLSVVASLIVGALSDEFPDMFVLSVVEYANILFLLVALLSLRKDSSWVRGLLVMIIVMLMLLTARNTTHLPNLDVARLVFLLAFYSSAIWLVGREVLLTQTVDLNKMVGSIALYLMLGLFFSVIYTLLLHYSPEALKGIDAANGMASLSSTTYFSFVTLTTLGYGDISPVTPLARVVVILEAVAGMFYLAMIVASLVGAMLRDDSHSANRPE